MKKWNNLTKNETDALQELSQIDEIIRTKADKGRAIVIIHHPWS